MKNLLFRRNIIMGNSGETVDYSSQYFGFTALEDTKFTFSGNSLLYSTDNGDNWITLSANTPTPTVRSGDTVIWKQTGLTPISNSGIGKFSSTGRFYVSGNIMSLYYGDNFANQVSLNGKGYAFYRLFYGCGTLVNARNLILPATTLAQNCYREMFMSCTSLIFGPSLPAPTLQRNCYRNMFYGCSSLIYIKCLATNISAASSTSTWVDGVAASGTFIKNSSITSWPTGTSGIPSGWTVMNIT